MARKIWTVAKPIPELPPVTTATYGLDVSILMTYFFALGGLVTRICGLTLSLNDTAMMKGGEGDF
jgi:hypothetical protein